MVRAENELVDVFLSVALADVDMGATNAALKVAPEIFQIVRVDVRAAQYILLAVLAASMVHRAVIPILFCE
jgi:hypothetical protein